jgi:drug/metabolite transporter (DMT)-like permease
MERIRTAGWRGNREAAGFATSLLFVCLASIRDVYLGGLFQRVSPPVLAIVAFGLCSIIFLPIAAVRNPDSFRRLRGQLGQLFWINVTTGLAWIAFFHALRTTEPMLVQILFAGVGPLTVTWVDRFLGGTGPRFGRGEAGARLALSAALVGAVAVALAGLSGVGRPPLGVAALGVALALGAGVAISISTVLCRGLNDAGVAPTALVSVRFLGAIVLAAALTLPSGDGLRDLASAGTIAGLFWPSLALIVVPVYVSQVGISLASPFTVRVVLAVAPAVVFVLQLVEGRLSSSPYSIGAAVLYGACAIWATLARQRAIGRAENPRAGQRGERRTRPARPDGTSSTTTMRVRPRPSM